MLDTKTAKVKEHLLRGESITPKEAYLKYGTMRLSAIIFNLKKDGMDIRKEMIYREKADGRMDRFAKYSLESEV